jgi:hypothetical protein
MTTKWEIICDDNNIKLLSKEEYVGGMPVYEGNGIYALQVPNNFYDRAEFSLSAQLISPNAPNNMRCMIYYLSLVGPESQNKPPKYIFNRQIYGGITPMFGINKIFRQSVIAENASYKGLITKSIDPLYKPYLLIKFIVPNDINKLTEIWDSKTGFIYPGKDWKLSLTFVFEDANKILERNNLEKKQKLAVLNEYTFDKLSNYTIVALKKICDNHEISRQGCKADIIARIINYAELVKKL